MLYLKKIRYGKYGSRIILRMQKGIRFKSGTTAITVFDETMHITIEADCFEKGALTWVYPLCHKSGYLPYFF